MSAKKHMKWRCGSYSLDLGRPLIMGILNITPDSFFDGGSYLQQEKALAYARQLVEEGADIIDIGAESSRPGAKPISAEEEIERLSCMLEALSSIPIPISIDTYKPDVMSHVIQCGASIINDISGFESEEAISLMKEVQAGLIVMHMQGRPQHMQQDPKYDDVVCDVCGYLLERRKQLSEQGIHPDRVVLDPGFGFGKKKAHNFALLNKALPLLSAESPLLVGISRKSMLSGSSNHPPSERLINSILGAVIAIQKGASIVRVHDVKQTRQALDFLQEIEDELV